MLTSNERVVYLLSKDAIHADDEVHLLDVLDVLWDSKWLITGLTTLIAAIAIIYALSATEWYRSEVLLAPAEEKRSSLDGQFGGLAALAGVGVGGGNSSEPIAVLTSREFIQDFINENKLLWTILGEGKVNVADDASMTSDSGALDIREAVKLFQDNVLSVKADSATGLVTVSVEWTEADTAAEWANLLVNRLNERMRNRALRNAKINVAYLQAELKATNLVALQQSIGRLLESEMQKLMLARGNEEFSFKIIDRAVPPKYRSRPRRTLIVALTGICGSMLSALFVLIRWQITEYRRVRGDVNLQHRPASSERPART